MKNKILLVTGITIGVLITLYFEEGKINEIHREYGQILNSIVKDRINEDKSIYEE